MTIFVDGKEQELTAVDAESGLDWTQDLLGNYDALHYDEDQEIFTMSQEDFEWWQPVVEKLNRISELENDLTPEDKEKYFAEPFNGDLTDVIEMKLQWLQEHFAELEKAENMEHIKYELIENTREVHYKDRAEIKKGCTRDQTDQNPETIKSFDSKDEALEALKDYKSEILEFSSHGMIYFNVKEFYVEENVYDGDGEWISGGDVWEFSEMPIAELIKARPEIVSSTDISASDLEIMSKDEAAEVREAVAANENTPAAVLEILSNDKDWFVRSEVAGNKNTPVNVLEELSKDEDIIRSEVAGNKNTPVNVLEELSKDADEFVRREVAGNKNTPVNVLEALSKDEAAEVREAVAANENTPAAVLEMLSKDESLYVRREVAGNKNTPVNVLEALSKDPDEDVREAANERLENQHYISASDLKEAKAEKDVRDAAAPKQEQKQKAQEQGLE